MAPEEGESVVPSSVDNFWKTQVESILEEMGVQNVIVTGTAAPGAVLHTATAAGFRGMGVILPVTASLPAIRTRNKPPWNCCAPGREREGASFSRAATASCFPRRLPEATFPKRRRSPKLNG
ncbi:MAG: isochorismatase family protein [Oceanidesulfovibrio sp.]